MKMTIVVKIPKVNLNQQTPSMEILKEQLQDSVEAITRLMAYNVPLSLRHLFQQVLCNMQTQLEVPSEETLRSMFRQCQIDASSEKAKETLKIGVSQQDIYEEINYCPLHQDSDHNIENSPIWLEAANQQLKQLLAKCQQIFLNKQFILTEFFSLEKESDLALQLSKIGAELIRITQNVRNHMEEDINNKTIGSNPQCSCTISKQENSNKSSVRSLLTQTLRRVAKEDSLHDENKQKNITPQTQTYQSKIRYPLVQRNIKNDIQLFSLQYDNRSQKAKQFSEQKKRNPHKSRARSQRLILGEINLSECGRTQKKTREDSLGYSRCDIY